MKHNNRKVNENTKVALTYGQLKELVKEAYKPNRATREIYGGGLGPSFRDKLDRLSQRASKLPIWTVVIRHLENRKVVCEYSIEKWSRKEAVKILECLDRFRYFMDSHSSFGSPEGGKLRFSARAIPFEIEAEIIEPKENEDDGEIEDDE